MIDKKIIDKNQIVIAQHLNENLGKLPDKINVFLTDLKGQILFEEQNAKVVDITNLNNGCYIIFLTDLEGGLIKKIKVVKE